MSMKKADLEKLMGKKIGGADYGSPRGGGGAAQGKREQALARKRELLKKKQKSKK